MLTAARGVLVSALLGAAVLGRASAQAPAPIPPASPAADAHPAVPGPPPGPPPPLQNPYAPDDPGPDGWTTIYNGPSRPRGLFFDADIGILHPVLSNRLVPNQPLPSGDRVMVPSVPLEWVAAPWLEAGYRLRDSYGLFAVSYRFFSSQGSGDVVNNDLLSPVRTRLELNQIDVDYGTSPYSFAPRWTFNWRTGVRLAQVFFDSRMNNDLLHQQASNSFKSAGFHGRLEVNRYLDPVPGLSLYARSDLGVVIGRINQQFREVTVGPDGAPLADQANQNGIQTVPTFLMQAGLGYCPPRLPRWRFTGGYQFEHWWFVGQLGTESNGNNVTQTRGEFGTQGLFLRAQYDF
jgi:hypothetical protein